ncbi:MAG: hypothetical protein NTY03_13125 [Candidatus Bathyarchaeota archaeon]|nr:hypothetical protein [Candidatus Bathyarchaeota archaeon]
MADVADDSVAGDSDTVSAGEEDIAQGTIPVQGSAMGDVDPEPETPSETQRQPEVPSQSQTQRHPELKPETSQRQRQSQTQRHPETSQKPWCQRKLGWKTP